MSCISLYLSRSAPSGTTEPSTLPSHNSLKSSLDMVRSIPPSRYFTSVSVTSVITIKCHTPFRSILTIKGTPVSISADRSTPLKPNRSTFSNFVGSDALRFLKAASMLAMESSNLSPGSISSCVIRPVRISIRRVSLMSVVFSSLVRPVSVKRFIRLIRDSRAQFKTSVPEFLNQPIRDSINLVLSSVRPIRNPLSPSGILMSYCSKKLSGVSSVSCSSHSMKSFRICSISSKIALRSSELISPKASGGERAPMLYPI